MQLAPGGVQLIVLLSPPAASELPIITQEHRFFYLCRNRETLCAVSSPPLCSSARCFPLSGVFVDRDKNVYGPRPYDRTTDRPTDRPTLLTPPAYMHESRSPPGQVNAPKLQLPMSSWRFSRSSRFRAGTLSLPHSPFPSLLPRRPFRPPPAPSKDEWCLRSCRDTAAGVAGQRVRTVWCTLSGVWTEREWADREACMMQRHHAYSRNIVLQ